MVGNKHVFWQAFFLTVIVFLAGMLFGYYVEKSRASEMDLALLASEANLMDEQLRSKIVESSNLECDLALGSTFAFADRVYEEAQLLERYDSVSKFNRESLIILHKKYDLLRTQLWIESLKTKEKCGGFHTLVYFFNYAPEDVELRAKQAYYSRLLLDLKEEYGNKILLIPIAANLNLSSVDLKIEEYKIGSAPAILIDEKTIVNEVIKLEDFRQIVFLE